MASNQEGLLNAALRSGALELQRLLAEVNEALVVRTLKNQKGMTREQIQVWMYTPLPALDGKTPDEALEQGRFKELMNVVLALPAT